MKWLYSEASVVVLASKLESLNFSLGEALYFGRTVAASPLAVHREVAALLDAEPHWIGEAQSTFQAAQLDGKKLLAPWQELRDAISSPSGS
jgi:hypothetical protein